MGVKLPALVGNYDRQTNQTDRPTDGLIGKFYTNKNSQIFYRIFVKEKKYLADLVGRCPWSSIIFSI